DHAKPSGVCLLIDSIETSTDNLITIEDIAMTGLITALALTAAGLGFHGGMASAQCPSKGLPCAQAPSKCPPAPSKACPQACPQAPSKACPQAPAKCAPSIQCAPQAPVKAAPQY